MNIDERAIFRFVQDKNEDNPFGFFIENHYHKLTVNGKQRNVPCLKMFGKSCPCCEMSQKFYNEENKEQGIHFWRKIDYIAQGFVIDSPFGFTVKDKEGNEQTVLNSHGLIEHGQNPIRLINMGPKILKLIQHQIASKDSDLENIPYDLVGGYDFRIRKSKQGEYSDYSLSSFNPKASDVDETLIDHMDPFDLSEFRTREITAEEMQALIEADLTGSNYDSENRSNEKETSHKEESTHEQEKPASAPASASSDSGEETPEQKKARIMAAIKNRNKS
jgi:hypothetical protein